MSLRIIYDFASNSKAPPGSVVLRSMPDLVKSATRIDDAARSRENALTVVVCDPILTSHLEGYKASYPTNVSEESADLLAQLATRVGKLPEGIDEDIVREGDLLNNQRPPEVSIADWILNRLFGTDSFGHPVLDPIGETRLLCALCQNLTLLRKQFVLENLQNSLAAWQRAGSALAGWLCKQGPSTASAVLVGGLLAGYPSTVLQQALCDRDLVPAPPAAPIPAFPGLAMPDASILPPHIVDRLDTLVHDVLIKLPLREYLSCVSGALRVELDILTDRVMDEVDVIPVAQIRDKFRPLVEAGYADRLCDLENLWAVKRRLVLPATEGHAGEVWYRIVGFFEEIFLPAWKAARSSPDTGLRARLIEVDEQYSEWLVKHFFELSLVPNSPLADRVMHRSIQRCTQDGMRVVWLVIDGAAWHVFTELLEPALREHAAQSIEVKPCIAALPTITDIAMLSLVSLSPAETVYPAAEQGLWKRIAGRSRKDREEAFRSQFPNGIYRVVRSGKDVIDALREEGDVYCLIYSEVDRLVHKNSDYCLFEQYQKTAVEELVRWVFRALETTDKCGQSSVGVKLLVTTDHGWTDNFRDQAVGVPLYLSQGGLVEVSHNRILVLRQDCLDPSIREALESDWYILSGSSYRLPPKLTFLLPRRLAPVANGGGRSHGGASMLETIVPLIEVAVSTPAWADLVTRLDAVNLVAASTGQARLTVKNPNAHDIGTALVRIDELQVCQQIGPLPREQTQSFDLIVVPTKSGSHTMEGVLEYEIFSANRRDTFVANVVVQPSEQERMAGKHLADGLFDDMEGR